VALSVEKRVGWAAVTGGTARFWASLALVAVFSSLITRGCMWYEDLGPRSTLVEDLNCLFYGECAELTKRLRTRFPVGTLEPVLAKALQDEGFNVDWPREGQERRATASWYDLVCNTEADVAWRAERGRLVEIRGLLNAACL
jgi:hypothetical protein